MCRPARDIETGPSQLRGALPQISLHQAFARRRRTSRGGAGPRLLAVHLQLFTLTDSSRRRGESNQVGVEAAPPLSRQKKKEGGGAC